MGDRLDILIANAGISKADISKAAALEDYTVEDFDRRIAVNVRAPFFLVQQLMPQKAPRIPSSGTSHRHWARAASASMRSHRAWSRRTTLAA